MYRIKTSYIAAFISAGVTLIFVILSFMGQDIVEGIDYLAIIDVVLVVVLAILIMIIKSRVASIILFVYFLLSKIILFIENPVTGISSILLALMFIVAFYCGIIGTFSYHKIKKQEKTELINEIPKQL